MSGCAYTDTAPQVHSLTDKALRPNSSASVRQDGCCDACSWSSRSCPRFSPTEERVRHRKRNALQLETSTGRYPAQTRFRLPSRRRFRLCWSCRIRRWFGDRPHSIHGGRSHSSIHKDCLITQKRRVRWAWICQSSEPGESVKRTAWGTGPDGFGSDGFLFLRRRGADATFPSLHLLADCSGRISNCGTRFFLV